ncbi:MMPL family transporter [Paenibacillus donghaensis]|uniref:MMPL family transporter n=1 Tax=Paenibacillus donghaensis TaxID=414771 RepID=UPI0018841B92|nr:MMPL family transporter [Paenibacillus donghaensis]MBE9914486.1 MMPL family transporter [Paenibacillus donghaensis]
MEHGQGWGRFVAGKRSKWVTLAVWILIVGVLSAMWPMVNKEVQNNAANLPDDLPSVQAAKVAKEQFGSGSVPALLVWHREGGLQDDDLQHVQKLFGGWATTPVPYQDSVPPFDKLPVQALRAQLSQDQSTLVTPVLFRSDVASDHLKEGVQQLKNQAAQEFGSDPFAASQTTGSELSARVTGPVGISIDAVGLFKNADFKLMMATVILVLVILLVIYRSPILALIPLVAIGFAYGAISPLLGLMAAKGWITVDSQAISIMTVLLFGAGTDYCLFLVSHFRHLLREEESKGKALLQAITETSGAIAMSGFTVVLSLLALLLARYGAHHRFAVPFSVSILVMVVASLTLVPALLAIFGRVSFFPFIPRTLAMEEERARRKGKMHYQPKPQKESFIGRLVIARPWMIVIVTLVVLGGLASFSGQVKFTYDIMSSFPKSMESREGYDMIGKQFSPGVLAPVKLMVEAGGHADALGAKLAELPYIDKVSKPQKGGQNSDILAYDMELEMNPYSTEAIDSIPKLRETAEQSLREAGIASPEDKVWIGGQTAIQYDTRVTGDRDTLVIIPVVIGMITLLLLVYLRSVTATVYLVLTVILSYFSALGLGWIIIHYGLGADAIQGAIPLYSFVFLVALGEDYNIFMISSIWKKKKEMPFKQAIKEGVGETGSVITSAGLILAGTFAVLASLPIQVLVQFGIITAVGVLLDTFIVRPFLVPAITTLLGSWAFWPSKHAEVQESAAHTEIR